MKTAKILTMGGLATVFWVLAWFFIKTAIYQGLSLQAVIWPSLLIIFAVIFLTFFSILNKNLVLTLTLDAIITGSYLLIMPKDLYVALAGGIFYLFLVLFEKRVQFEARSRMNFSIRATIASSVALTVYAMLLLIGFNVYHSVDVDFKAHPDAYYEKLAEVTASTVPYVIPNSDPMLSSIIAQSAVNRVHDIARGYEKYVPIMYALAIAGLLWTFAHILSWLTAILGWGVFQLMLWMKFFKLDKEMVEIQKLTV